MVRFAYADPPYIGQAKRHYAKEAAKDGRQAKEVNHRLLVAHLAEYDGWALSLSSSSLEEVLHLCREVLGKNKVRIGSWVKPMAFMKPWIWPCYAWEPVIFRRPKDRPHRRDRQTPFDWHQGNPYGVSERERTSGHGVKGSKPEPFSFWLFDLLDLRPEDEFTDLFPGSGGVTLAWNAWRTWDRHTALVPSGEQLGLESIA